MIDFSSLLESLKKFSQEDFNSVSEKIKQLIKTSQEQDKETIETTESDTKGSDLINVSASLFSKLKANLEYSQVAHWSAKGGNSYSDHLLYERIYNDNVEEIDKFAEKMIPIVGETFINPIEISVLVSEKLKSIVEYKDEMPSDHLAKNLLNFEQSLLEEIDDFRRALEMNKELSLGLDDLITELHNSHQGHIYLLSQRLKG